MIGIQFPLTPLLHFCAESDLIFTIPIEADHKVLPFWYVVHFLVWRVWLEML